jgi:hypothetical protein
MVPKASAVSFSFKHTYITGHVHDLLCHWEEVVVVEVVGGDVIALGIFEHQETKAQT